MTCKQMVSPTGKTGERKKKRGKRDGERGRAEQSAAGPFTGCGQRVDGGGHAVFGLERP